jgi:hypothetical protein
LLRADETLRGESVPEVDTVCMMLPELPRAQVLHIWKKTFQLEYDLFHFLRA